MSLDKKLDKILIIDFGSQFTQLIVRRIRELGVYSELVSHKKINSSQIKKNTKGIILSGGPLNVYQLKNNLFDSKILKLSIPVLGICFGHQIISKFNGGKIKQSKHREFGLANIIKKNKSLLIKNFFKTKRTKVWMSHADQVYKLPKNFKVIASSKNSKYAIVEGKFDKFFGVQFHPEVTHTENGLLILKNFIFNVCNAHDDWKIDDLISSRVEEIKNKVCKQKVLLGLSGGVDSSVTAVLLNRAIGKNLTCVFVDNGLLRKGESEQVMQTFKENLKLNVIKSNSQDLFLRHLENVDDPEQKRKIIGRTFIDVFDSEAIKLKDVKFLAQGTIYPDVIESSGSESNEARVIKSHHNVGGLPDEMELDLIEPLRDLFKDEVRRMGIELGIPKEMLERHPFPGPGLGVRIIGEITKEKTLILQEADNIFIEELINAGLYEKVSQAFAVLLPVKSVGVVGDERRYAEVIALRAVETVDFMTARWAHLPYDFLEHVSNRIVNEIEEVSRVVYDISSKPPATIEWE